MTLHIRIVKAPEGVSLTERSFSFDEGGTIGRGTNNSWTLPDPERILSSRHCEFSLESGEYYVTDLSTNGTFINEAPEPLGKGSRAALSEGDHIEVGDYSFVVEFGQKAQDQAGEQLESPFGSIGNQPFDDAPPPTPFTASEEPKPWFGGQSQTDGGLSLNPVSENVDPLQALDQAGLGAAPPEDPFSPEFSSDVSQNAFGPDHKQFADYQSPMGDTGQAGSEAVAWPEAVPENLIPDDWDLDEGEGDKPSSWGPLNEPVEPASPEIDLSLADGDTQNAQPVVAPNPGRAGARDGGEGLSKRWSSPQSTQEQGAGPSAAKAERRPVDQGSDSDTLIAAMGLDPSQFDQAQGQDLQALVGTLMRDVVGGLMQVMRSRASIKNEFRMNVTTIQPVENNPLKFSADVNEAMENIFVRRSDAYMSPTDAVQEGFREIAGHQVAVIAGMREAFEQMLKSFDPQTLEKGFQRQRKPGPIPPLQRSRYWQQYTEHFASLTDNLERSFQHTFGDVFVQAYEDQLRRLAATQSSDR